MASAIAGRHLLVLCVFADEQVPLQHPDTTVTAVRCQVQLLQLGLAPSAAQDSCCLLRGSLRQLGLGAVQGSVVRTAVLTPGGSEGSACVVLVSDGGTVATAISPNLDSAASLDPTVPVGATTYRRSVTYQIVET